LLRSQHQIPVIMSNEYSFDNITGGLPPTYDSNGLAAIDVKKDNSAKIDAVLDSEDTKEKLRAAISELQDSVYTVERSFRTVSQGLQAVAGITRLFSRDFCTRWDERCHKKYVALVWESKRVAGIARATASDFAGDFMELLKDDQVSLAEKKEEIAGYREQLLRDQNNAKVIAQGFTDLQGEIIAFHGSLKKWMMENSIEKAQEEIIILCWKIMDTEKKIANLKKQILRDSVMAVAQAGCAAALMALGVICPLLWVGAGISAVRTVRGGKAIYEEYKVLKQTKSELEQDRRDIEQKRAVLKDLQQVQPMLEPLGEEISSIAERLTVFFSPPFPAYWLHFS